MAMKKAFRWDLYRYKRTWKGAILLVAGLIGVMTLVYTEQFTSQWRAEEEARVQLWADALEAVANPNYQGDLSFVSRVLEGNTSIPVMLVDKRGTIMAFRNLSENEAATTEDLESTLRQMKAFAAPVEVKLSSTESQYVYRSESRVLQRLHLYPRFLLAIIGLFMVLAYVAFSQARRAEQDRVWTGMARETAHQLGTPLTALMGWVALLRDQKVAEDIVLEMEKDVERLQMIADRFSKMGSEGGMERMNLSALVTHQLSYLSKRLPTQVKLIWRPEGEALYVQGSAVLLGWVLENLVRNAVDAMEGKGTLTLVIERRGKEVLLDVTDTGKGMGAALQKMVFRPGYTTKARGWGLGLALAKRIVVENHKGLLVVYKSTPGTGTTFRLTLPLL